jgi:RNAse (barnase) inhibitor barstar
LAYTIKLNTQFFFIFTTDWIAKIIEDKNTLLKKCEDIFNVITDKTYVLDFLWNHVWEQVKLIIFLCFYST